jgi:tetratricopeptide (TPR) repeat protein
VRVFISYSHDSTEQKDRVWGLCERLRNDGVDCRIDQHEASPPEGWSRWCTNQVQESQFVLVVCTAIYKQRYEGKASSGEGKGVKWEGFIITQELYEAEGRNTKFIPVVFSPGDVKHIPLELKAASRYDLSTPKAYEDLLRHITNQPTRVKSPVAPQVRPMPPLERRQQFGGTPWNVPIPPNPFFTGREKVMAEVEKQLDTSGVVALTGLGGVGKTQITAQFAHEHRNQYSAVLWASAASQEALVSDFAAIARLLNLPQRDEKDQSVAVAAVKRWLAANGDWLLIVDNADDLASVRGFIPQSANGHVLLTTQAQATGDIQAIEILDMLPEDGALLLLRRAKIIKPHAPSNTAADAARDTATNISKELGGLPLALDQAGAYTEETRCGLASYLELYRECRAELLKKRGGFSPPHPESVATTFALSFERVERANHAAADLLRCCAFLHPDAIPEEIFTEGAAELGSDFGPIGADPLKLNAAYAEILKFSLVRRDADAKTLSIHHLVQLVLKDGIDEAARRAWAERAVRATDRAFPEAEFPNWGRCERLLSQALACAELIDKLGLEFPECGRLLNQAGRYLFQRARLSEAEQLLQRALAIWEKALGHEHLEVAMALNNLGAISVAQGKHGAAESFHLQALAIRGRVAGPDHPDFAISLMALGDVYRLVGRYMEAEAPLRQSLAVLESGLGREHPFVASSLHCLGLLYADQGKYAQAVPFLQREIAIREKVLAADDPDIAPSLGNLAGVLFRQGKHAEAEKLLLRALAIGRKALGPDHPDLAPGITNLADMYRVQGKYLEAETLCRQALAIEEKFLGAEHPAIAHSLHALALVCYQMGRYAETESLYQRALAVAEKALDPEHPHVATILENYAVLLREKKRGAAARELEARAKAIRAAHAQKNAPK